MSDNRPNPLAKAATVVGAVVAGLAGLIGAAVQIGIVSPAQADAMSTAGAQLPTLLTSAGGVVTLATGIVAGLLGAFGTAALGKKDVTPVSSPAIEDPNNPGALIPLVPKYDPPASDPIGDYYSEGHQP